MDKEEEPVAGPSSADVNTVAKHVFLRTGVSLCIICQGKTDEILPNPRALHVFEHVSKRSEYGYKEYPLFEKR